LKPSHIGYAAAVKALLKAGANKDARNKVRHDSKRSHVYCEVQHLVHIVVNPVFAQLPVSYLSFLAFAVVSFSAIVGSSFWSSTITPL
jgi:hypothetical protein